MSSLPSGSSRDPSASSSLKQLKGSLTLDLSSPTSSRKQHHVTEDLLNLIKASPGIEKIFAQGHFLGLGNAATPTPTKLLYPTDVTLAQRQYAQGFIDALTHVQQLNGFVPTPTLLNSPSFLAPLIQTVASSVADHSSKSDASPVLSSPARDSFSVIMQAMGGMGGLPGYNFSQIPHSQLSYVAPQPTVPSTSSVVTLQPPIKSEVPVISDESKESSYDVYADDSTNDPEGCSSSRSNVSPRSQDELMIPPYPAGFDVEDQEKKKLERKRARNRMAATKCRQRKLQKISELEKQVREEKYRGDRLSDDLKALEAAIVQLRQTLHEHRNRGCAVTSK